MAIELQSSKEDKAAAAKGWAQIDELIRICDVVKSSSDWEAVALACLAVGHCLQRSKVGGLVGQGGEGILFLGAQSRRGGQQQELGSWRREWLQFLVELRALKGFHLNRGGVGTGQVRRWARRWSTSSSSGGGGG